MPNPAPPARRWGGLPAAGPVPAGPAPRQCAHLNHGRVAVLVHVADDLDGHILLAPPVPALQHAPKSAWGGGARTGDRRLMHALGAALRTNTAEKRCCWKHRAATMAALPCGAPRRSLRGVDSCKLCSSSPSPNLLRILSVRRAGVEGQHTHNWLARFGSPRRSAAPQPAAATLQQRFAAAHKKACITAVARGRAPLHPPLAALTAAADVLAQLIHIVALLQGGRAQGVSSSPAVSLEAVRQRMHMCAERDSARRAHLVVAAQWRGRLVRQPEVTEADGVRDARPLDTFAVPK